MKIKIYDFDTDKTTITTIENFENDFNNDFINSATTKIKFVDENNLLNKIKSKIDWLESHNKNYTKQQYNLICDIQDLLNRGLQW